MSKQMHNRLLTDVDLRQVAWSIASQTIESGLLDLVAGTLIVMHAREALAGFGPMLLWLAGVAFIGPLSRGWTQFLARFRFGVKLALVRWPTRLAFLNAVFVLLALAAVVAAQLLCDRSSLSSWSSARIWTTGMVDPLLTVTALAIAGLLTPCTRFYYYALLILIAAPLALALGLHQQHGVLAVAAIMTVSAGWRVIRFFRRRRALAVRMPADDSHTEDSSSGEAR